MKKFIYTFLVLMLAGTSAVPMLEAAEEGQEKASYVDIGGDVQGKRMSEEEAEEVKKYIHTLQQGIRSVNDARQASRAVDQSRAAQELRGSIGANTSVQSAQEAKATGMV